MTPARKTNAVVLFWTKKCFSLIGLPVVVVVIGTYLYEITSQHRWQHYHEEGKVEVLILGDSISIGYTPVVINQLADIANVNRPLLSEFTYVLDHNFAVDFGHPVNCEGTTYTLEYLDAWLGTGKWDVIHANWGLWDARRSSVSQYTKQLDRIVTRLKRHTPVLVIATTTPISERHGKSSHPQENATIIAMNQAISELSQTHGFYVNDLYALVQGHPDLYSQNGRHLSEGGYTLLGNQVADVLESLRQ